MPKWYVLTKPKTDECVAITTLDYPRNAIISGGAWVGRELSRAEYKTYRRMGIPIVSCYFIKTITSKNGKGYDLYGTKPDIKQHLNVD